MSRTAIVRRALPYALALAALATAAAAADRIPVTTSSDEARQLYLKGRDLNEKLRATDGRKMFEQAAAKDPSFALAQVGLANTSGTAREFFDAVAKAVALADKASEPERQLICALDAGAKGEPARQKDCLSRLLQLAPDDERAHTQMALFHFGRQDYAPAIEEFKKAIEINPQFSAPYNQLGYAYRAMARNADAEQAFKKYIELIPSDPNPYDSYAELLMKMGRFEDSIKNYEKALAVDPHFVASYIGIGNDRVFLGQPAQARESYAKLLAVARTDGERLQAHFWTAMAYVHEGQTDKAVAELEQNAAIDKAGKDQVALSGTLNQIGNVLLEAGRTDAAAAKFAESIAVIDKADALPQVKEAAHRQALFDEARIALARNDLTAAKARAAAYAAAADTKKLPFEVRQTHELAGRLALAQKDYAAAVAELKQANQQDPRVLYLTALALQGKGDLAGAKQAGVQAADFNGLSNTYGYVRAKAKAIAAAPAKN